MKIYPVMGIMIVLCAFVLSGSQTGDSSMVRWKKSMSENDEYIHALLAADRNVLENAKVLIHDLVTKKAIFNEMALYHTDEMGRSLKASEQYLTLLEKATDIAMDEIYVGYLTGLHKHYTYALEQLGEIQAELKKALPGKSVIIMKTTTIYAEMKNAESEQTKMNERMDVKEPEEPTVKK